MNTKHFRHGQCKKNFVKYVIEPSFKYTKNKFHLWETHFPHNKKRSSNRQLQNFLKQRKSVVLYKRSQTEKRTVKYSQHLCFVSNLLNKRGTVIILVNKMSVHKVIHFEMCNDHEITQLLTNFNVCNYTFVNVLRNYKFTKRYGLRMFVCGYSVCNHH